MRYKKYLSNYFSIKETNRILFFTIMTLTTVIIVFFLLLLYVINNKPIVIVSPFTQRNFVTQSRKIAKKTLIDYSYYIAGLYFSYLNYEDYLQKMNMLALYLDPTLRKYFLQEVVTNAEYISKYEISQIVNVNYDKIEVNTEKLIAKVNCDVFVFAKGEKVAQEVINLLIQFYLTPNYELLVKQIKKIKEK